MPVLDSSGTIVPRSQVYKPDKKPKQRKAHKTKRTKKNPKYMTEELARQYTDQRIGQMLYNQFKD